MQNHAGVVCEIRLTALRLPGAEVQISSAGIVQSVGATVRYLSLLARHDSAWPITQERW
jgi:hypothetical protein